MLTFALRAPISLPRIMRGGCFLVILLAGLPGLVGAVAVGDSRAAVLAELGHPRSTMAAGAQEILTYPAGRVVIKDGKVSVVQGQFSAAPTAELSTPPSAAQDTGPPPHRRARWHTDIGEAIAAADNTDKRILALFTGSDWCPPCQNFEAEVAHDEQFAGIFHPHFVFFKCDWLRQTPQPREVAEEVSRLRRAYGIRKYPTLKILDAQGEELAEVDWTRGRAGSFKEIMIEAIDDARRATEGGKKASRSWWPF